MIELPFFASACVRYSTFATRGTFPWKLSIPVSKALLQEEMLSYLLGDAKLCYWLGCRSSAFEHRLRIFSLFMAVVWDYHLY